MDKVSDFEPGPGESIPFSASWSQRRNRGGAMRCLLLQGKYMIYCTAVKEGYIPSTFELDEYCRQIKHKMCPLYCEAELSGKLDFSVADKER